jgi:hypothetical protein
MNESNEAEIVSNYRLDTLYTHDFKNGGGKYFTIVSEDKSATPTEIDYNHPYPTKIRVKTTLTFIKKHDSIEEISFKRFKYYKQKEWVPQSEEITFPYDTFKKIIDYLQLFDGLNLKGINERRIALAEESFGGIDEETKKKMKTLLLQKDGQKIVEELIQSGLITSNDIVNIGYRKSQLEVFEKLLNQEGYIQEYQLENQLKKPSIESTWQFFFQKNDWIFGYGLDYRFLEILQNEAQLGNSDLMGRDAPIGDFLLGCSKFTVLVEVKRPDTHLFGKDRNRANCWTLSDDLIGGVSQILEQKASWAVHAETNSTKNYDDHGDLIKQMTIDPKSILIIGSSKEFEGDNKEQKIKSRTFELFRRDSRNIDIITYNELFERARFIVAHKSK